MSLSSLRKSVYSSLHTLPGVHVTKRRRSDGASRRTRPVLDFSVTGSPGEPDRAELELRLAVGGGNNQRNEERCEALAQKVEDRLPAQVDPPAWTIEYDLDASSWVATATCEAFRE